MYLEHEITSSIHVILSLLDLPFVLGGVVVWIASFLVYLAIGVFVLWLVQVIFFFVGASLSESHTNVACDEISVCTYDGGHFPYIQIIRTT